MRGCKNTDTHNLPIYMYKDFTVVLVVHLQMKSSSITDKKKISLIVYLNNRRREKLLKRNFFWTPTLDKASCCRDVLGSMNGWRLSSHQILAALGTHLSIEEKENQLSSMSLRL